MTQDVDSIRLQLQQLQEHIAECYAALDLASEGDSTAVTALGSEIDSMAQALADLRSTASSLQL
jgi:phage terminase large subunit-like protein